MTIQLHTDGGIVDYVDADAGDQECDPHVWIE